MQSFLSIHIFDQMSLVISLNGNREGRFFVYCSFNRCKCSSSNLYTYNKIFKSQRLVIRGFQLVSFDNLKELDEFLLCIAILFSHSY
jgi:hypothetical protein